MARHHLVEVVDLDGIPELAIRARAEPRVDVDRRRPVEADKQPLPVAFLPTKAVVLSSLIDGLLPSAISPAMPVEATIVNL